MSMEDTWKSFFLPFFFFALEPMASLVLWGICDKGKYLGASGGRTDSAEQWKVQALLVDEGKPPRTSFRHRHLVWGMTSDAPHVQRRLNQTEPSVCVWMYVSC